MHSPSGSCCCASVTGAALNAPNLLRKLRLRLIGGLLLLLLKLLRPGWNNTIDARVGNRLAQMLAPVPVNHHQGAAQGGLPVEHFLRLTPVRIAQGENRPAKMRKRFLQHRQDLRLVSRKRRDSLEIKSGWGRGSQGAGNSVIGADDVRVDFADGPNSLTRPPGVFLGRHSLR